MQPAFVHHDFMTATTPNPFNLPELRALFARYVSLSDATACARVCKDWSVDFIPLIWHTIDLAKHGGAGGDPQAVARHGHHIRIIRSIWELNQVLVFRDPSVCQLTHIEMTIETGTLLQAHCLDLIRLNKSTLVEFSLQGRDPFFPNLVFPVDVFSPTANAITTTAASSLTRLNIAAVVMTRDSFSLMLRYCTSLATLKIQSVIIHSVPVPDIYQHLQLKNLTATVDQVFVPDPDSSNSPSLLVHFPNLEQWTTWVQTDRYHVSPQAMKAELALHCPLLTEVTPIDTCHDMMDLLRNGFERLTAVSIWYEDWSPEIVNAILTHRGTLQRVLSYVPGTDYESSRGPAVIYKEGVVSSIQSLLLQCHQLSYFSFPMLSMDINELEKCKDVCGSLEVFQARIQGLDTREKTMHAVCLWSRFRRMELRPTGDPNSNATATDDAWTTDPTDDTSIEVRVARFLLKFEKLHTVSLGWRIWKL
ncbi:MAG: hypothetical protein J3Q66DRAFT_321819 [Benniella sp.]|nr:MAG: hypothetical protein J3Q66DRAFT_321819 [Benniella sp.]